MVSLHEIRCEKNFENMKHFGDYCITNNYLRAVSSNFSCPNIVGIIIFSVSFPDSIYKILGPKSTFFLKIVTKIPTFLGFNTANNNK
jgi:hypothetical protein